MLVLRKLLLRHLHFQQLFDLAGKTDPSTNLRLLHLPGVRKYERHDFLERQPAGVKQRRQALAPARLQVRHSAQLFKQFSAGLEAFEVFLVQQSVLVNNFYCTFIHFFHGRAVHFPPRLLELLNKWELLLRAVAQELAHLQFCEFDRAELL